MAEPVRIVFGGDNDGIQAQGDSNGNLYTTTGPIVGTYKSYKDAAFVVGSSPATHDFNADAGRNSQRGYIICDGAGDIDVAISHDGTTYGDTITMSSGESISLDGFNVDKIRVTHVTDSAYRILLI